MAKGRLFQSEFEDMLSRRMSQVESSIAQSSISTLPINQSETTTEVEQAANFDAAETRRTFVSTDNGNFWIVGNTILTECPDCQAPMTIRSWLKLADCWRCHTSTQLTKSQLATIEKLVEGTVSESHATANEGFLPEQNQLAAANNIVSNQTVSPPERNSENEFERLTRESVAAGVLRRGLSGIPAWLISFLLHLLLILLLALFVFRSVVEPSKITLSTFVSPERKLGGEMRIEDSRHKLVDDLKMANDLDVDVEEIRDVLQKAQNDAAELTKDNSPLAIQPDIDEVRKNVTTTRDKLMSFAARDPRVRAEIVQKEGGTSFTEAAVARGLRWLASVQNDDGSWSLSGYDESKRRNNRGDVAATSLALLPFLGAGQTHEIGIYKENVAKGLRWLLDGQKPNGDLRINFPGTAGMYAHGQAAIVLCEALAMTGDQKFKKPAQLAIDFIEQAQHQRGGWRYRPKQIGDTSVLGWQLMALQSARAADTGVEVDSDTLKLADYFLDQATYKGRRHTKATMNMPIGSLYTYRVGEGRPTATMTAEALLCRMYLGWKRDDPRVIEAIRWLVEKNFPSRSDKNIYYWYYATQVMHHFGGDVWKVWNRRMREILVAGQTTKGSRAGSWNPRGYEWGSQGGRIYVTSLSICTLEVYYRHLPIFNQIDLDGHSAVALPRSAD